MTSNAGSTPTQVATLTTAEKQSFLLSFGRARPTRPKFVQNNQFQQFLRRNFCAICHLAIPVLSAIIIIEIKRGVQTYEEDCYCE